MARFRQPLGIFI